MNIDLIKCHGSGNDFLLIDEYSKPYQFTESQRAELTRLLCNREEGIGADGILFVMKSKVADAKMRVFNTDGSEASMCGNGLRCVARYVCEMLKIDSALIETMRANLKVGKQEEIYPQIATYQVEISPVSFLAKDLPLNLGKEKLIDEKINNLSEEISFTAVAVPNPHLIAIVDEKVLQSDVQKRISEFLNAPNEFCPDGVNVSFVKLIKKGHIYVRTFERGVGFTNACGTAMSASTLVTCLNGMNELNVPVNVYNNGGKVLCTAHEIDGEYTIDLIGNATYVFSASVELSNHFTSFKVLKKEEFSEQPLFGKLQADVKKLLKESL